MVHYWQNLSVSEPNSIFHYLVWIGWTEQWLVCPNNTWVHIAKGQCLFLILSIDLERLISTASCTFYKYIYIKLKERTSCEPSANKKLLWKKSKKQWVPFIWVSVPGAKMEGIKRREQRKMEGECKSCGEMLQTEGGDTNWGVGRVSLGRMVIVLLNWSEEAFTSLWQMSEEFLLVSNLYCSHLGGMFSLLTRKPVWKNRKVSRKSKTCGAYFMSQSSDSFLCNSQDWISDSTLLFVQIVNNDCNEGAEDEGNSFHCSSISALFLF